MSSAKDTFEPKTFAANTFQCGTWRGSGPVPGPYCLAAAEVHSPGVVRQEVHSPGVVEPEVHSPGITKTQVTC